jgi:hypothetical protein
MHVKVQDRNDLVRDTSSSALLNIDNNGLAAYKARRDRERVLNDMISEFGNLRNDINEIKILISRVLESK